jgi:putative sterol carrier protein
VSDPLLSDAWLASCNVALATLPVHDAGLVVTELITDAPEGVHDAVTLVADADGTRLVAGELPDAQAWLSVSYVDADAMHAGDLDPARALADGKLRIRGDLRAVVDAAALLSAAQVVLRRRLH